MEKKLRKSHVRWLLPIEKEMCNTVNVTGENVFNNKATCDIKHKN